MAKSMCTSARAGAVLLVALALLTGACSGSSATTADGANGDEPTSESRVEQVEPTAVAPPATATPVAAPTPAPEPTAVTEPAAPAGPQFWNDVLVVGDCIVRPDDIDVLPEPLSCDEAHEEEIYAITQLDFSPDEPYPGEEALADMTSLELCDEATVAFGGETWDLLPFDTFLLYPLEQEWLAGDRTIMCSASAPGGEDLKIGTAAGGTLDTDDVIVARSTAQREDIDTFDYWALVSELSTNGSLTDGRFDLPLRRAFPVEQGFMFNAVVPGEDGPDTHTWGYRWDEADVVDLDTILPGQEVASTMTAGGHTVFAARAEPDGDWDVRVATPEDEVLRIGGEGDQRFPSFTPDFSQVVYHDQGDLWIVNVDGTDPRQLTSGPATDWESAVSPDGQTVVFASDRSGNDDIWRVSIDGGEPVNLTNHPGDDVWPFFSADGQRIYFSSDRLKPDSGGKLMMMELDGSNQSYFSLFDASHGFLVDAAIAEQLVATTPTLIERYDYELIEGEAGGTTRWTHSSGRLSAEIPVGWRVVELDDGIGFVTAVRPDRYFETWAVDGVSVVLIEDVAEDDFFTMIDDTQAVQDCEQFDGSDGAQALENGLTVQTLNHDCGTDTVDAVAGVIAVYDPSLSSGALIEGQRDNVPDADSDSATITAIALSTTWE